MVAVGFVVALPRVHLRYWPDSSAAVFTTIAAFSAVTIVAIAAGPE
jgi:hypothetical protein